MTAGWDVVTERRGDRARRRGVVSVVFLGLVLAAGGALVLVFAMQGGRSAKPASAAPTAAPHSVQSSAAPSTARAPSAAPTDSAIPSAPPPGVHWELFRGVALPVSDAAGPSQVTGPVYAGYAHTPTGALLALAQIETRYLVTPGDGWRAVVAQQVAPGVGRDTYTRLRAGVVDDGDNSRFGQIAGFRFVTYDPHVAVIQMVTKFAAGMQVTTGTVVWSGSDWLLQLQPDGSASPNTQQVATLAGYVPWSGVS